MKLGLDLLNLIPTLYCSTTENNIINMSLLEDSELRRVSGISSQQEQRILDFLQGAIYSWCKNNPDQWFSMRDLMGGENYYWQGTPLIVLYNKHTQKGKSWDSAVKDAGKDSGWLLKKVVHLDKRTFETKKEELIRKYKWVGNER